tara:strand:+ start:1466 stop:1729 length:264 start_codon:yes stop_codon:yes gene_type:complete
MEEFILKKGIHFTPPGLMMFLNEKYGGKLLAENRSYKDIQKTSFNLNDVHQYILHGKLPNYLEKKSTLKELYIPMLGKKILELKIDG